MPRGELEVMGEVDRLLSPLQPGVRNRVIRWAAEKYTSPSPPVVLSSALPGLRAQQGQGPELPGIARLQGGRLRLTVRDLKARNTNDAAVRIAHIALLAWEQLTGRSEASSRKLLVPLLREWRAYDGNTRRAVAACKGIVRNGDTVALDAHAHRDAEVYVHDVLDPSKMGTWRPGSTRRRARR